METKRFRLRSCSRNKWRGRRSPSRLGFIKQWTCFRSSTWFSAERQTSFPCTEQDRNPGPSLPAQVTRLQQRCHGAEQILKTPRPPAPVQVLADKHWTVQEHLMFVWEEPSDFHQHRSTWSQEKAHLHVESLELSSPIREPHPIEFWRSPRWKSRVFTCLRHQNSFSEAPLAPLLADQGIQQVWGWWRRQPTRAWRSAFRQRVVVTGKVPFHIPFALMSL